MPSASVTASFTRSVKSLSQRSNLAMPTPITHTLRLAMTEEPTGGARPRQDHLAVTNRHLLGVENLMWSMDYPHHGCGWPETRRVVEEMFRGVPEEERRRMCALPMASCHPPAFRTTEDLGNDGRRQGPQARSRGCPARRGWPTRRRETACPVSNTGRGGCL